MFNVPKGNAEDIDRQFRAIFPQVPGVRISLVLTKPEAVPLEFPQPPKLERLIVPTPVRLATWFEQADYTAPIWFNAIALTAWILRIAT